MKRLLFAIAVCGVLCSPHPIAQTSAGKDAATHGADKALEGKILSLEAKRIAAMSAGTQGHALWPELDVRPEDETVLKYRYSAFLPGTSELPDRLRALGFDTVLITGTVTNVCCESSARDAMMLNFKVVMVHDVLATYTDEEHNATLRNFYSIFGDVQTLDGVIGSLKRGLEKAAA